MDPEVLLLYFHPPVAIAAYLFIIINAVMTFGSERNERWLVLSIRIGWVLTLIGLISGMIWAQIAWGTYWNWDPKETANLALFLTVSAYVLIMDKNEGRECSETVKRTIATERSLKVLAVANILLVIVTLFISKILDSLHSHYV